MNIGTQAVEALVRLKDHPDWVLVLAALGEAASKAMNDSLASDPPLRVHATSYAAGIRDTFVALHAVKPAQVKKPGVTHAA